MINSHLPPDEQETVSEMAYPSSRSRYRQPARHSSRAMMPLRRLDTLREVPSVNILGQSTNGEREGTAAGVSRTKSCSGDSRLPAPRRHLRSSAGDSGSADNLRNGHQEAEADEEPSAAPPAWAAESRDSAAQNPLLPRPRWNPKTK